MDAPSDDELLTIAMQRDGDTALITLSGELDGSNATRVDAVTASFDTGTVASVVFELEGLTFMDSSGIAALLRCVQHVRDVELRHASHIVRTVIETTGLASTFRMVS